MDGGENVPEVRRLVLSDEEIDAVCKYLRIPRIAVDVMGTAKLIRTLIKKVREEVEREGGNGDASD